LQKKKHMKELKKDYLALLQKSALNGIDLYTLLEFGKMIHRLFPSQQIAAEIEAITKQHKPTVRVTSKPTGYAVYTPKPIEVAKKKAPITAAQYSVKEAVAVNEKAEPTFDNLKEWDANQYAEHFGDFDKVAEFAKDKLGIVIPEKISPMKLIKLIKTSLDASKD
jgi:hypothetical protein